MGETISYGYGGSVPGTKKSWTKLSPWTKLSVLNLRQGPGVSHGYCILWL